MCGYHNPHAFKTIDDSDINYVENYVKSKLPNILDRSAKANGRDQFDDTDGVYFYGHFAVDIPSFEITKGEKRLLESLVAYVKLKSEEDETHFEFKEMSGRRAKKFWMKELYPTSAGYFFGFERNCRDNFQPQPNVNISSLKETLFTKANKIFIQSKKLYKILEIQKFGADLINVRINNGKIKGSIKCIFCDPASKIAEVSLYCKQELNSAFWVGSNLTKHIKIHHAVSNENHPSEFNSDYDIEASNFAGKHEFSDCDELGTENEDPNTGIKTDRQIKTTNEIPMFMQEAANSESGNEHNTQLLKPKIITPQTQIASNDDSRFSTLVKLVIEPQVSDDNFENSHTTFDDDDNDSDCPFMESIISDSFETSESTIEDQLYHQMTIQTIKMSNSAALNDEKSFTFSNVHLQVKVGVTKPDGNCLFSSISHQLSLTVLDTITHEKNAKKLRQDVVTHIRSNIKDYVDQMKISSRDALNF